MESSRHAKTLCAPVLLGLASYDAALRALVDGVFLCRHARPAWDVVLVLAAAAVVGRRQR